MPGVMRNKDASGITLPANATTPMRTITKMAEGMRAVSIEHPRRFAVPVMPACATSPARRDDRAVFH
jgi:hypothetical protein